MFTHAQLLQLCGVSVGELASEYRFDKTRRWRVDFAHLRARVAIEIEGGVWTKGRHTRASGYVKDMEKYNALAVQGWRLLRFTPQDLAQRPDYVRGTIKGAVQCAKS